jgi:hypothetical protein
MPFCFGEQVLVAPADGLEMQKDVHGAMVLELAGLRIVDAPESDA